MKEKKKKNKKKGKKKENNNNNNNKNNKTIIFLFPLNYAYTMGQLCYMWFIQAKP